MLRDHWVGPVDTQDAVRNFIQARLAAPIPERGNPCVLILEGPSGCGKVTLVRSAARVLQRDVVEFSNDCKKSDETFAVQLRNAMTCTNVCKQGARPIVVLRSLDQWESQQLQAFLSITRALLGTKQPKEPAPEQPKKKRTHLVGARLMEHRMALRACNPIIVTTSDQYYAARKSVRSVGQHLAVAPLIHGSLTRIAKQIAKEDGGSLTDAELATIVQRCQGDLRFMFRALELGASGEKDPQTAGYLDACKRLFVTGGPPMDLDLDDLVTMAHWNHCSNPNYSMAAVSEVANAISECDLGYGNDLRYFEEFKLALSSTLEVNRPKRARGFKFVFPSRTKNASANAEYLRESSASYGCRRETPFEARDRIGLFRPSEVDMPFLCGGDQRRSRTMRGHFELNV